jgi:FkbM family methyltransferase
MLAANLALNGIEEQVEILPLALADFTGQAGFTTDLEECNHLAPAQETDSASVEVRRLDDLVLPSQPVSLVKIDVEGFDQAVLRGGQQLLLRDRPVLIVETWAGAHDIRVFLGEFGYQFYLYRSSLVPFPRDFSEDANLIAIHPERLDGVKARLLKPANDRVGHASARWLLQKDWSRPQATPRAHT